MRSRVDERNRPVVRFVRPRRPHPVGPVTVTRVRDEDTGTLGRLAALTGLTVASSTGAHLSAGGHVTAAAAGFLLLLTVPLLLPLAQRAVRVRTTGPVLGGLQLVWHTGLTALAHPAAHTPAATTSCGHPLPPPVGDAGAAHAAAGAAMHLDVPMLLGHLLAGVLLAAWVRHGEDVLRTCTDLLARVVPTLVRPRHPVVPVVPVLGTPEDDASIPRWSGARFVSRRGPPRPEFPRRRVLTPA